MQNQTSCNRAGEASVPWEQRGQPPAEVTRVAQKATAPASGSTRVCYHFLWKSITVLPSLHGAIISPTNTPRLWGNHTAWSLLTEAFLTHQIQEQESAKVGGLYEWLLKGEMSENTCRFAIMSPGGPQGQTPPRGNPSWKPATLKIIPVRRCLCLFLFCIKLADPEIQVS